MCKELRGKAGVKPHSIKNILDQTDAPLDARHNHSGATANTSFTVSWTLAWAQNGDLTIDSDPMGTDGISEKMWSIVLLTDSPPIAMKVIIAHCRPRCATHRITRILIAWRNWFG